jgi:hypothetical protein
MGEKPMTRRDQWAFVRKQVHLLQLFEDDEQLQHGQSQTARFIEALRMEPERPERSDVDWDIVLDRVGLNSTGGIPITYTNDN